ncbi:hypothetical protein HUJ04_012422 [Dendroctonus ponderosae]|nr:hypothetical protein HUJ04_012422 [Dendroctonus ponderosae]
MKIVSTTQIAFQPKRRTFQKKICFYCKILTSSIVMEVFTDVPCIHYLFLLFFDIFCTVDSDTSRFTFHKFTTFQQMVCSRENFNRYENYDVKYTAEYHSIPALRFGNM